MSLLGDAARLALRFDATAVRDGQLWRLLTAHLVHLGNAHAALNAVGLGLLAVLFAPTLRALEWTAGGLISALTVSLGLLWLSPELDWYVGLSGVLHGLFVIGAVSLSRSEGWLALGLLAGLAMKLAWEQFAGPVPGSELTAGGPVVVDAHLYGAVGGWIATVATRLVPRKRV
ncbi:MAG: rhombosortase [Pseudomonadota bacterium]